MTSGCSPDTYYYSIAQMRSQYENIGSILVPPVSPCASQKNKSDTRSDLFIATIDTDLLDEEISYLFLSACNGIIPSSLTVCAACGHDRVELQDRTCILSINCSVTLLCLPVVCIVYVLINVYEECAELVEVEIRIVIDDLVCIGIESYCVYISAFFQSRNLSVVSECVGSVLSISHVIEVGVALHTDVSLECNSIAVLIHELLAAVVYVNDVCEVCLLFSVSLSRIVLAAYLLLEGDL